MAGGRPGYRAKRWPLRVLVLAVVVALTTILSLAWRASQQDSYSVLPTPVLPVAGGATGVAPSAPAPSASGGSGSSTESGSTSAPSSSSGSSASATVAAATGPVDVAPSPAVQIYIPNANPDLVISTSVAPLGGCRSVIDPPRTGPGWGGVFGCTDFAQPGTTSPSLSVLAGHSSQSLDTVFNKLYRQGTALEHQMVYLRTQDSGGRWLAYRVEHTYVPEKDELPYMTSVWGGDGTSTSGRLVLVTCQQTDTNAASTANYVAVAQLVGVV